MRKTLFVLALPVLVLLTVPAPPAEASEKYLGTIVSTNAASKNNGNTAATFTIPKSSKIRIQCDVAAYVASAECTTTSCAATANDRMVEAGSTLEVQLVGNEAYVGTLCVSATSCSCRARVAYP